MDKIAVILPVYKRDCLDWFKLSIDSILTQSYKFIHLYIGVDGPLNSEIDNFLLCLEQKSNINIVRFEVNRGLAYVLNDLLDICINEGYEYIARMDADDISMPDRLEKQLKFLKENPRIDVVGGSIEEINDNSESLAKIIIYPASSDKCRSFFSKRNPHAHPTVMFRRIFFEKIGHKYRSEYRQNQDTMLWFDGFKAGTQNANIPDIVLKFRMSNAMFKQRRTGWSFAKKQLIDRKMINKELKYGIDAKIFAYAMFCMLVSPVWLKRILYKFFR